MFDTIPKEKLVDYLWTVEEVIALQSTVYYAQASEDLGYYTIAQNDQNYLQKIGDLLIEYMLLVNQGKSFSILELGGGTGRFAKNLVNYITEKDFKIDYTIIDVSTNQYRDKIKISSNFHIIQDSFTNFVKKNKKEFDFLIMNEALDMWAGKEELIEEWDSEKLPFDVFWVNIDLERNLLVKKKDLNKIQIDSNVKNIWLQVFFGKNDHQLVLELNRNHKIKIRLPEEFLILIRKIRYLTVVQDYWSFSEQQNGLRMGLYLNSIDKTIERIMLDTNLVKEKIRKYWVEKLEKNKGEKTWIESEIIPFGLVDVTYSPDQSQLYEICFEEGLEIVTYDTKNFQRYASNIYETGGQENEIFVLFTKKALDLQFKLI